MNHEDKPNLEIIVRNANRLGYIDTQNLCFILAENQEYDIDGLMRIFEIDTRRLPKPNNQTPYRQRVGKWWYITQKLTSWDFAQMQENPIQLYESSPTEGWRLIGLDERYHAWKHREETGHEVWCPFIKLTDLEKWFAEGLKLPFPSRLIPRDTDTQDQGIIDPNRWLFHDMGAHWRICFNGIERTIEAKPDANYILPLIKQPREPFGYIELCQRVKGKIPESHSDTINYLSGLRIYAPKNDKPTNEEKRTMRGALCIAYKEYLANPYEQKDRWTALKIFAERRYGLWVKESGDELDIFDSKCQRKTIDDPMLRQAGKTVSRNKIKFLEKIKEVSEPLYKHFKESLVPEGGWGIKYDPPDGSPDWKVIE